MKPFDSKGEYTPDEVKAALAGIDGTRQLSFRYERLDKNNTFIEEIDYVQSCSIENNSLADIKRTAKFDILDTGRMNYLQDRIKPYVRLSMVSSDRKPYTDVISDLDPDIWYKFDDPTQAAEYSTLLAVPADLSYSTFDTALDIPELKYINPRINAVAGTVRTEFWGRFTVADSTKPLRISIYSGGTTGNLSLWEQPGSTQADLVPVPISGGYYVFSQAYAKKKTYYFRMFGYATDTTANASWIRPQRVEDSSGNGRHGTGNNIVYRKTPIVLDGGYSVSSDNVIENYGDTIPVSNTFSGSMWYAFNGNGTRVVSTYCSAYMPGAAEQTITISTMGGYVRVYGAYDWYSSIVYWDVPVPVNKLKGTRHVAWTVDYLAKTGSIWLNGVQYMLGLPTSTTGTLPDTVSDQVITKIEVGGTSGPTDTNQQDDTAVFFNRSLSHAEVLEIYQTGTVNTAKRSGYVEWPQGVFVLSSPTRKMQDGNTVVREVEGYDQLVVLKEDSYDYRYSVAAGTKYTDAVAQVLNYRTPVTYPITGDTSFTGDSVWAISSNVTVNSPTSVTMTSVMGEATVFRAPGTIDGISLSGKVTIPTTAVLEMAIGATYDKSDYYNHAMNVDTGVLNITSRPFFKDGGVVTTLKSIPYDAVAHAYWRIRESGGTIYWEVSPDGGFWTTLYSKVHGLPSNIRADQSFFSYPIGSGSITITDILAISTTSSNKNITDSPKVLPTTMEWEPGTSKLSIINDLLSAVNYTSATYNEDGIFTARPYVSPADRTPEYTYATDEFSVIVGDVSQTVDLFAVPNKWVVVVSDPDRPALVGSYTNASPNSPTSTVSRGRTIVDYRTEQSAPDQLTLDAQAARLAFEASQIYEAVEFETALMPIHETADVYYVAIDGLVIDNKYSEQSWSMALKSGATMSHKIRRIVTV